MHPSRSFLHRVPVGVHRRRLVRNIANVFRNRLIGGRRGLVDGILGQGPVLGYGTVVPLPGDVGYVAVRIGNAGRYRNSNPWLPLRHGYRSILVRVGDGDLYVLGSSVADCVRGLHRYLVYVVFVRVTRLLVVGLNLELEFAVQWYRSRTCRRLPPPPTKGWISDLILRVVFVIATVTSGRVFMSPVSLVEHDSSAPSLVSICSGAPVHLRRLVHIGDGDVHRHDVAVIGFSSSAASGMPSGSVALTTTM